MNCIEKSIKNKWIPIINGEHENQGENDCDCCKEHRSGNSLDICDTCPIYIFTGKELCKGTPYDIFIDLEENFFSLCDCYELMLDLKAAAQMELDFLELVNKSTKEE